MSQNIQRHNRAGAQPRPKRGRFIGYGPLDELPKNVREQPPDPHSVTMGLNPSPITIWHPSQLGPVGRALYKVGCCEHRFLEATPGDKLKQALAMIRPGDTLVIFDAMHASGRSARGRKDRNLSRLRKLKHKVEERGGKLMILRVGHFKHRDSLFVDWEDCEPLIRCICAERRKAAGSYKPGKGRPPRIDPATVGRLKNSGLSVEQIMAQTGYKRSTVYYALKKLETTQPKAA